MPATMSTTVAAAQEVTNSSTPLLGSLSVHDLDARAMGDHVPSTSELNQAFSCSTPQPNTSATKTVLLVHGVGANAEQSFSWNLIPQLASAGYDVCWVNLPHNGRGDLTQAGLYAAHAVKLAQQRLGKNIGVVGHSAGPPVTMWALRYDADAAAKVDDVVALAGALHGTALIEPVCKAIGNCPALAWQMHPQSNFVKALNAAPLPATVDVTSIYSKTDEGIQPAQDMTSWAGATQIAVQDICPTHIPGHMGILADNAAYHLVIDALSHPGPASPARVDRGICSQFFSPNVDVSKLPAALPAIGEYLAAFGEPRYSSEPPLPTYAQGDVTDPADPDDLAAGSSQRIAGSAATIGDGLSGSFASSATSSLALR